MNAQCLGIGQPLLTTNPLRTVQSYNRPYPELLRIHFWSYEGCTHTNDGHMITLLVFATGSFLWLFEMSHTHIITICNGVFCRFLVFYLVSCKKCPMERMDLLNDSHKNGRNFESSCDTWLMTAKTYNYNFKLNFIRVLHHLYSIQKIFHNNLMLI